MNFYSLDTLCRQSADWDIQWNDEYKYFIIDNYYENAEDLYQHIVNKDYPLWKYNEERDTPNGIDYLDCRIVEKIGHPTRQYENSMNRVLELCRQKFHKGGYDYRNDIEVNCFKTINVTDNKLQHYPHIDGNFKDADENAVINMLVYLDKVEDAWWNCIYENSWFQIKNMRVYCNQ